MTDYKAQKARFEAILGEDHVSVTDESRIMRTGM